VTVTNGARSGNGLITVTYTLSPAQLIASLQGTVTGLGLPKGLTTALNSKLQHALDADDTAGACDSLQAFLNQVKAQTGKKIPSGDAQELTDAANDIRTQLDC
jgi:FIMAH domain